jgi:hypothetical protein
MAAAVDAGMIPPTPCRRVPLPKIDRQEMRFLSPQEIARLAAAIRPDYRALILLGAYGGLRIGEMAGLRRGRVDPGPGPRSSGRGRYRADRQTAHRPTEDPGGRSHGWTPQFVVEALAERMSTPGRAENFVFAGPKGGVLRVATFRSRFWRPAGCCTNRETGPPLEVPTGVFRSRPWLPMASHSDQASTVLLGCPGGGHGRPALRLSLVPVRPAEVEAAVTLRPV